MKATYILLLDCTSWFFQQGVKMMVNVMMMILMSGEICRLQRHLGQVGLIQLPSLVGVEALLEVPEL